jgi:aryl-alcohol dehydrogenase-like predicted oxidoreductase
MWAWADGPAPTTRNRGDRWIAPVELGCNFFDNRLRLRPGPQREALGRSAGAPSETKLYTATKVPPKKPEMARPRRTPIADVFPYDYIIEMTEKSLANLGVATVDLQQLHVWSDAWVKRRRMETSLAEHLKRRELVLAFGISVNRWDPSNVIKALRTGLVDAVQVVYNVFDQKPGGPVFPLCRELDVAVIARVPLDEGSLTGTLSKGQPLARRGLAQHLFHAGESRGNPGAG